MDLLYWAEGEKPMTTISSLKERLDDAGTLVEAQSIVNYALAPNA
jgi:hypothetical protein